jgi:hypothetical protein
MITVAATYPVVRPIIFLASLSPVIVMKRNVWNCCLMSPALFERATKAARMWGGSRGLFPHFVTIENETQAAADHAAVVVEINID